MATKASILISASSTDTNLSEYASTGLSLSSTGIAIANFGATTFGILNAANYISKCLVKTSLVGFGIGYVIAVGATSYKIHKIRQFSKETLFQAIDMSIDDTQKALQLNAKIDTFVQTRITEISDEELEKYQNFNDRLHDNTKKLMIALSKRLQPVIANEFMQQFPDIKERLNSPDQATKEQGIIDAEALIQDLKDQKNKQMMIHIISLTTIFISLIGCSVCIVSAFCPALIPVGYVLAKVGSEMFWGGWGLSIVNSLCSMSILNKKGFHPNIKTFGNSVYETAMPIFAFLKKIGGQAASRVNNIPFLFRSASHV